MEPEERNVPRSDPIRRSKNYVRKNQRQDEAGDLLRSLPEHILLHILSFLPTKDAVKTSALSKAWQFLWTLVPSLEFSVRRTESYVKFAEAVDKTLILHSRPSKIQKFLVDIPYGCRFLRSRVDTWVRFAVRHQVEEFGLVLHDAGTTSPSYELPGFLFKLSCLTKLRIGGCLIIQPVGGFCLPSLKVLSIESVELTNHLVAGFLSGCPSLEVLELVSCWGRGNFKLTSTSLTKYIFRNPKFDIPVMEIWLPNCRRLKLLTDLHGMEYRLKDVSSLVELNLQLTITYGTFSDPPDLLRKIKGLVQQFHKLEKLTLQATHLKGHYLLINHSISDIDFGPIRESWELGVDDREAVSRSQEKTHIYLQTLRRVEIIGFGAVSESREFVDSLVKFLLNNALVLEEMIIHTSKGSACGPQNDVGSSEESRKLLKAALKILGYKRASPAAKVLFIPAIKFPRTRETWLPDPLASVLFFMVWLHRRSYEYFSTRGMF